MRGLRLGFALAVMVAGLLVSVGVASAHWQSGQSSYHCKTSQTDAYISGYVTVAQASAPYDTLSCTDGHTTRLKIMDAYTYLSEYHYKSVDITLAIVQVVDRCLYCQGAWWKGYGMPDDYNWTNYYDPMTCHQL